MKSALAITLSLLAASAACAGPISLGAQGSTSLNVLDSVIKSGTSGGQLPAINVLSLLGNTSNFNANLGDLTGTDIDLPAIPGEPQVTGGFRFGFDPAMRYAQMPTHADVDGADAPQSVPLPGPAVLAAAAAVVMGARRRQR